MLELNPKSRATIRVLTPGLMTTIQDRGRFGLRHIGVSTAGPADALSHRIANLLVGNRRDSPTLEMLLGGAALRFLRTSLVALTGAEVEARVGALRVPVRCPVWIAAGSELRIGRPQQGSRVYLAISGEWQVPELLGSRSTHVRTGLGPSGGRPLRTGDTLAVTPCEPPVLPELSAELSGERPAAFPDWSLPLFPPPEPALRLLAGPDFPALTDNSQAALFGAKFRVDPRSDRMAVRLDGTRLFLRPLEEKLSSGVTVGSVQLLPTGEPLVLHVDCQTTGGYPLIGAVASVDLPRLGQLRPGEPVRFVRCTLSQAHSLLQAQEEWVNSVMHSVPKRDLHGRH